jgi:branched-chain amino acid transport system substrate-binding protein
MPGVRLAILALALVAWSAGAGAADKLKIGFITTLSWPGTTNGQEILDAFRLGIDDSGGKLGGRDIDLVVGDDVNKPDLGVQLARRMIEEDKVALITGFVGSNVTLAAANVILPRGLVMLVLNGGPSSLAGKSCNPNLFDVSFQSDTPAEAMAIELQNQGVPNVFLVTQNWQPGRDALAGFKRYFKRAIAGEVYAPLDSFDYAADLAEVRAAKPAAMYFFFTGGAPVINFVKQLAEAGLDGQMKLYTQTNPLDDQTLPGMGDAALGIESAGQWSEDLDNPANRGFVGGRRSPRPTPMTARACSMPRCARPVVRSNRATPSATRSPPRRSRRYAGGSGSTPTAFRFRISISQKSCATRAARLPTGSRKSLSKITPIPMSARARHRRLEDAHRGDDRSCPLPRRPCRQPVAAGGVEGGA